MQSVRPYNILLSDSNRKQLNYAKSNHIEPTTTKKLLVNIDEHFTFMAFYDGLTVDENEEIGEIFAQVADIDLTSAGNTIECDSEHGLVRFTQQSRAGEVSVSIGEESVTLKNIANLHELQSRVRHNEEIENNYVYIKAHTNRSAGASANADCKSQNRVTHPHNIVSEKVITNNLLSTVTQITYKNGVYFFKPIGLSVFKIAELMSGIPTKESHTAERSMFSYKMSCVLGFHVIPDTHLAENKSGMKGFVQGKAPGISAKQCMRQLHHAMQLDSLKQNNDIIRQLVELQLLDALMGQVDRHADNYFIDLKTNKVTGIDNDACCGFLVTHPHSMIPTFRSDGYMSYNLGEHEKAVITHLRLQNITDPINEIKAQEGKCAGRAVFLPPVMDRNMVEKLTNLSDTQLMNYMDQFSFTTKEKSAACSRLQAIKDHISVLESRQSAGKYSIIEAHEWSSPATLARLFPQDGNAGNALQSSTTYLHRDMGLTANKFKPYVVPEWVKKKEELDQKLAMEFSFGEEEDTEPKLSFSFELNSVKNCAEFFHMQSVLITS